MIPGWNAGSITGTPNLAIKSTRVALRTTVGTQDISIPGVGIPKAAMFVLSAAESDAGVANLSYTVGATDGTDSWTVAMSSDNAVVATDTTRCYVRAATARVAQLITPTAGSVIIEISFSTWLTNGVRISVDIQTPGIAYLLTVTLFGGTDLTASVGTAALAAQDAAVTKTTGFQTNALIVAGNGDAFTNTSINNTAYLRYGLASYDGTTIRQCTLMAYDAEANPTATEGKVRNDSVVATTTASALYVELGNITSTAFDLTSRGMSWVGNSVGYLALNLANGKQAWAGVVDSPTATGDKDFTDPNFQPKFALFAPGMHTAVNTENTAGLASAVAISTIDASAQYCTNFAMRDAVATTDTQSLSDDQAINLDDHTGAAAFDATFVSFISTGTKLNFSAVPGTARKWMHLAIG